MSRKVETLAFLITCLAMLYLYQRFLDNAELRIDKDSKNLENMLLDIRNLVAPKKAEETTE